MKTLFTLVLVICMTIPSLAQNPEGSNDNNSVVNDSTKTADGKKDTTRIVIGKKEIRIIDTDKGTDIKLQNKDEEKNNEEENDNEDSDKDVFKHSGLHSGGFHGHWSGVEFSLANYLNADHQLSSSGIPDFLSLNTSRSVTFSINGLDHSFGLIGNQVGLVTGLGLEFTNYFFDNNNSIQKDANGVIITKDYTQSLDKSKLAMTYLTVPVLLEFQLPGSLRTSKRLRFAVGVIGGLKLRSHTKVVYQENGNKQKDKLNNDFNISSLRYGLTARIGYSKINLFANYYPVTLFETGKMVSMYPINIGIAFVDR